MLVESSVSHNDPAKDLSKQTLGNADLVFYFLSKDYPQKEAYFEALRQHYPVARIVGCTTGGEIAGDETLSGAAVAAAIKLEYSTIKIARTEVSDVSESYTAGKTLAGKLADPTLRSIFILTDGLKVNGSNLVRGLSDHLGNKVVITGGLAGDGALFKETGVGIDGLPESGVLAAIGFYGDKFQVSYGSMGGFHKFGPERIITRSQNSILYELDGKPALDLYRNYLGEEAKNLPGSGLLFPLSIRPSTESEHDLVRTIVGIDEDNKSLIFAGDVPEGYTAQLMRGNTESLTEGARAAAKSTIEATKDYTNRKSLAILVSCIGRNLLMGQQASNEVEAVQEIFNNVPLIGFYSYGEICHHSITQQCDLHNQTMTITLFSEAA